MREILFRGKRAKNKEWIYGSVLVERDYPGTVIVTKENHNVVTKADVYYFDVIPETVEQYTGFTDKNGTKIFEGDILSGYLDYLFPEVGSPYTVVWHDYGWYIKCGIKCGKESFNTPEPFWVSEYLEVIGNIHDNPELLERGAK